MTLTPIDSSAQSTLWLQQQQNPAMLGAWAGRPDPGQTPTLRYTPTGVQNAGKATTPEIEAALTKAQTATSVSEKSKDYQAVSKVIVTEALDVPLMNLQSFGGPQVAAANVHGLQNWVYIQDLSQGITVG
jgi:ABC-type transport system substrate-binding protein